MELNKNLILEGEFPVTFNIPGASIFNLPEKILQFGTGVLLRGLPDFFIDKANKKNVFNGRIVVVKSTGDNVSEFSTQDNLYTHCIKGVDNGNLVEEYIINASISKVLSAKRNWNDVLQYAENADLQIIISNTTEVGIALKEDDNIHATPPESFPAKLLAFLYKRYQHFNGREDSGMVIIPTELIVDNGKKLKDIIVKLAEINKLDKKFIDWLLNANEFCNSLVDRIVSGALKNNDLKNFEKLAGYTDDVAIMSESYSLWAIESSSEKTRKLLSFYKANETVIITNDINKYRELKLRLLNGTHTFSCGLGYLAGFNLVYEAMQENYMRRFIKDLMMDEIAQCIIGNEISELQAKDFAEKVIERFSNPYIEHKWLSITMQYSAKMKMRNVPLLLEWYQRKQDIPMHMAAGFAAYILFMKPVEKDSEWFYGLNNGTKYKIDDDKAEYFYTVWKNSSNKIVETVLSNTELWNYNLALLNGFANAVNNYLDAFINNNFMVVIDSINKQDESIS